MRARFGLCLYLLAGSAFANTYVVTKTADTNDGACDADCSLREAVAAANAHAGADTVRLKHTYYRLTVEVAGPGQSQLSLQDDVVIRGLPERTTIDANGTNRHFEIPIGIHVEIDDVTLRNGAGAGHGGSIDNDGFLILRRVWVIGNRVVPDASGAVEGGGIFNSGSLRIVLGKVDQNVAIDNSTFTGGLGGGIFSNGVLYVYDTLIRNNKIGEDDAPGFGAGVYNRGQARIERSYFGVNDPGGGEGSAIANRYGGELLLVNSTLSGNGHDGANGALANGSSLQDESASSAAPRTNLLNVTIANNNGGGLLNTGRVTLRQSIVAGNFSQDGNDRFYDSGRNCHNEGSGTMTQIRSLVAADGNCPAYITVDNATVFSLVLEHLKYLGGPTPVHKPRPGPYAIDNGDETCPSVDQRQKARPQDGNGDGVAACDLGAMELQPGE
jgi:CSLREA domain-containing protein